MITEPIPSSICLRVTRRCNAACSFCQAPPTSRDELSVQEIGEISRYFAARGVRSMKLSGGEPTVRTDLPEILAEISSTGLKPVIISNGMTVPRQVMDSCVTSAAEFKFSVHRPSAGNDAVLRRRSFTAITENMRELVRRRIGLSVNTVVTPASRNVMADMVRFARDAGARKISFIPVVSRGRARSNPEFSFRADELDRVMREVRELARLFEHAIPVHCIDIRSHDYWVVENDGSLWAERAVEEADRKICDKGDLIESHKGD